LAIVVGERKSVMAPGEEARRGTTYAACIYQGLDSSGLKQTIKEVGEVIRMVAISADWRAAWGGGEVAFVVA
jgi:hypothetical protein